MAGSLAASESLSGAVRDCLEGAEAGDALGKELQELNETVQSTLARVRERIQEHLNAIGDDAQLANVDLQNVLQKQQQMLQMMSNISKMLYDTAMSVIRKMGG